MTNKHSSGAYARSVKVRRYYSFSQPLSQANERPTRVATPVGIMDRRKEDSGNVMVRAAFRATIETPVQSVQCANTGTKRETPTGGSELRQGDVVSRSIRYNGCDKVFGKRYLAWRKIEFSSIGTMSGRPVAELRCSCYSDDVVVINSVSND